MNNELVETNAPAPLGRAALRVTTGGALAMTVTAAIGRIVGVAIG